MTISARQFDQLNEMAIQLWQRKTNASNKAEPAATPSLDVLATRQLFTDLLVGLGLSLGELSLSVKGLDLGEFTWRFSEQQEIKFDAQSQSLSSPDINRIAESCALKKQLWHMMQQQVLR